MTTDDFSSMKAEMETQGFSFTWVDEDVEDYEEDEETGREHKVKFHSKGWWILPPQEPGYFAPRLFNPADALSIALLNVMLKDFETRHDNDEADAAVMRELEEIFNKSREAK